MPRTPDGGWALDCSSDLALGVEKYSPDQPRDEAGRWTDVVGLSRTPENARRAQEARRWQNGVELRYVGGSRVALRPGEHVKVTGVYGMSDDPKRPTVYYTVRAADGARFTLADHTLRVPGPDDRPEPPGERPARAPKPAATPGTPPPPPPEPGQPPPETTGPMRDLGPKELYDGVRGVRMPRTADGSPDYSRMTDEQVPRTLAARTSSIVNGFERMPREVAVAVAQEYDRLARRYPSQVTDGKVFAVTSAMGSHSSEGTYAYAKSGGIFLNARWFGNARALRSSFAMGERTNFHPAGCNTVTGVLSHEFGHQVDTLLGMSPAPWRDPSTEWAQFVAENGHALGGVSRYAGMNSREAVAESFSQYEEFASGRYNGPLARGTQLLGEFLDRRFKRTTA